MENKITQEMIEQAKQAQSAEEILSLAKENGVEMTAEEAQKYYELWHTAVELSDEELDNVAGGCSKDYEAIITHEQTCPKCGVILEYKGKSVGSYKGGEPLYSFCCKQCQKTYMGEMVVKRDGSFYMGELWST